MKDIYLDVIRAFNRGRVAYVVIGTSGINYYATDPRQLIMTADFDILLKPEEGNVRKALAAVRRLGFSASAGKGPLKARDRGAVKAVVAGRRTLSCTHFYGNLIDLCLEASGFAFEELDGDAVVFRAGPTRVRVGRLEKLLRTKEIAARRKDVLFLEKYRLLLEEGREGRG